jgi:hypothetical protein
VSENSPQYPQQNNNILKKIMVGGYILHTNLHSIPISFLFRILGTLEEPGGLQYSAIANYIISATFINKLL